MPNLLKIARFSIPIFLKLLILCARIFGITKTFWIKARRIIKNKAYLADQEYKLVLLGAWCKGNRTREIPIRTAEQRCWLDEAKLLA